MNRKHTAPFEVFGPLADKALRREAEAIVERQCEEYVREKMKPTLLANTRAAKAFFFTKQNGR
jgi:hypothetical protein